MQIVFFVGSALFLCLVLYFISKKTISGRYAILWATIFTAIFAVSAVPIFVVSHIG